MIVTTRKNPWFPDTSDIFGLIGAGLWLSLAVWVGIGTHSVQNGITLFAVYVAFMAFFGGIKLALTHVLSPSAMARRASLAALALYTVVIIGLFVAFGAQIAFARGTNVPSFMVTHDYGDHMPEGELTRLRETDCKDYGPMEIRPAKQGWAVRCGMWWWHSHTYLTRTDPTPTWGINLQHLYDDLSHQTSALTNHEHKA